MPNGKPSVCLIGFGEAEKPLLLACALKASAAKAEGAEGVIAAVEPLE